MIFARLRPSALVALHLALAAPLPAASVLNFPRLSNEPNTLTGIAIANPSAEEATVMVTGFSADGALLSGSGISNPATFQVPAGQQVSRLTSELFGSGLPAGTVGWFQAVSPVDGLTGFFLVLDAALTQLDGADLPVAAPRIVFNQVRLDSGYTTELNLINPGAANADLQLTLVGAQTVSGAAVSPVSKTLQIRANGASRLDVAAFFQTPLAASGAYVTVSGDASVAGFELLKSPGGDLLGLNARSAAEQLTTLYFPQMAVLGPWTTTLGLVNHSSAPALVTLTALKGDGTLYDTRNLRNNPVTRALDAGASLGEDVATMFGFSGSGTLDGWIKVESSSAALSGSVSYGAGRSLAAVATAPQGLTRAIFSHIATTRGFFNGVAMLNPGASAANVRVVAIQPSGRVLGSFDTVLQPGQRLSKLIDELIPQAASQSGGILWIKSDQPIYLNELFGTVNTLANVPPQAAPESYLPDAGNPSLRLTPPLAPVQTGSSQQFQVQGSNSGGFTWRVNGMAGGNPSLGTVSAAGLYRAPAALPTPQGLTVSAENSAQVAGATVDVYGKQTLLGSLGLVQSVTYLDSTKKLYVAELTSLSAAKPISPDSAYGVFDTDTAIFEVSPGAAAVPLVTYADEIVSKMISFTASNGREYLLLAGQTTGRIIRLDPSSKESVDVFSGLTSPASLVIDPVTGDLLVAEASRIASVPVALLNTGLAKGFFQEPPTPDVTLFGGSGASGVAIDACTGNVYFSVNTREVFNVTAVVRVLLRSTGQVRTLFSGLNNPAHLFALYRVGISCPSAFHLLLAEAGANRLALVVPADGSIHTWNSGVGPADLGFLMGGTRWARTEGVFFVESSGPLARRVSFVPTANLYNDTPINPPLLNFARGVQVTVVPASATVIRGKTRQFIASVSGSSNKAVTWSATGGQISATGLYTAPPAPGSYKVTAAAQADPGKSDEASVRVIAVQVIIDPLAVTLRPGATQQFNASVSGSDNGLVTWKTTGGEISATGLYTAPAVPGTYRVQATSQADTSAVAEATVIVTSVRVAITPSTAAVPTGGTQQFTATVTGSDNTAVTWATTGGDISDAGLYTAPETAGVYTVRAASQADPSKFAAAAVTVTSSVGVAVAPSSVTVPTGGLVQFTAAVTGSQNTAVIWTATGGKISSAGFYIAPAVAGSYTVRATSQADPSRFADAVVGVLPVTISISPGAVTLPAGATRQFTATVTGVANTSVTWQASGGTISSSGLYTAPTTAGVYLVRATSQADTSKLAVATVTVPSPLVAVSISPAAVTLPPGGQQLFTATVTGTSNTAVIWSASSGFISASGFYVAPTIPGTYTVRATSQADTTKFAEATVTVLDLK